MNLLRDYYWLVKPGIVYSNALAASAGFLLASRWDFEFISFLAVIIGTSLVVACGCVLNNYIDRDIDRKMDRTKKRALAGGRIPPQNAFIYAAGLGLAGFMVLGFYTNVKVLIIGAAGLAAYVVVYGIAKRRSVHGTLIGTISGAMPPVAGYAAAANRLDGGALILFIILVCWQMPHFYSIAMYRLKDYKAAGLPVLPAVAGPRRTKKEILVYILLFTLSVVSLGAAGYAGFSFVLIMATLGLYWLWQGIGGFKLKEDSAWGRQMFTTSLMVLLSLFFMLSVGSVLP